MFSTNGKQLHLFKEKVSILLTRVRGLLVKEVLKMSSFINPVREGINTLNESSWNAALVKEVLKMSSYNNPVSWAVNGTGRRILTNEDSFVKTL